MSYDREIVRLEHTTEVVPVGSDAEHCSRCACAAAGRAGDIEMVEVGTLCGGTPRRYWYCGSCGAEHNEREDRA